MKLSEIYAIADTLAPKALSDEMCQKYGWYDNSGILVNTGKDVTRIVFALDLTKGAIEKAISEGAQLIMLHHPAIYGGISNIDGEDGGLGEKLIACIEKGISVVAMHLNLDAAPSGIDESLAEGVSLATGGEAALKDIQLALSGGGYGRVYEVAPTKLSALADSMKEVFQTKRVEYYGKEKSVRKIASFCGSGADEKSVAFAVSAGAEVMISSDFKHHVLLAALEAGLSVITLTHYASELYGFKKYYEKISRRVNLPCTLHVEANLL